MQCLHIFFTDGLTFIATSLKSIYDPSASQVIRSQFYRNPVSRKDPDEMHPHLAGNMTEYSMSVVQFNPEHSIWQRFYHGALNLNDILLCHNWLEYKKAIFLCQAALQRDCSCRTERVSSRATPGLSTLQGPKRYARCLSMCLVLTSATIRDILHAMHTLMEAISQKLPGISDRLAAEHRLVVEGFAASAKRLLSAKVMMELQRPLLCVADTDEAGWKTRDDLSTILEEHVCYFPAWDDEPDEFKGPEVEIVRQRVETLWSLLTRSVRAAVTTTDALKHGVVSRDTFSKAVLRLTTGVKNDRDGVAERLLLLGFESVELVEDVGQFSVRGGIIDVFPFISEDPLRIEFLGDRVESIRSFDVTSQRSKKLLRSFFILPYRELCLTPLTYRRALKHLEDPLGDGSERYLHLIHRKLETILDYLPSDAIVVIDSERDIDVSHDALVFAGQGRQVRPQPVYQGNFNLFKEDLQKLKKMGYHAFLLAANERQRDRFSDILSEEFPELRILSQSLHEGFIYPHAKLACFTDHEIFQRPKFRTRKRFPGGVPIDDILSLKKGDICVHVDHGIGRFDGMRRMHVDGRDTDCLLLTYRDGDRLYVPTHQMHRVQRYIGSSAIPPQLTKLGSGSWERAKRGTKKAVEDMTKELLEIHAARQSQKGHAFGSDTVWQKELESSFLYEETPDQLKAFEAVKADMESVKPMDRLVCGEVGYGKTEVAIRAAFKAVMDDRQVAVLVPTTILAQQHYNSFRERLRDFPLSVEMLSRLRNRNQTKSILQGLKSGTIDIVIGTHRLLSKDVEFKDLGLLIIDEEQRFGVKHKEKIKRIRKLVDCFTMSATPIPRTLYMSLLGIRDMTTIETPPADRLSVVTDVCRWDDRLIIEACLREVERGGQVFFVHNRVETIYSMADYLSKLLPELRIGIAHGQLPSLHLEKIMLDFLAERYDILLTSAIVESGVDVPNANTMFVNRADRFGLAQLHQLRGRVGRSHRRAYCYFLIPKSGRMTDEARRRLRAIKTFSDLGSGFQLALRDLEIRGAGNILGVQQHGRMNAVGFELYCDLLERAIRRMRGKEIAAHIEPIVSLDVELFIPHDYVPFEQQRIAVYKRLADAKDVQTLAEIRAELEDRFGPIPRQVQNLFDAVEIKCAAAKSGAESVVMRGGTATIEFPKGCEPTRHVLKRIVRYPVDFVTAEKSGIRLQLTGNELRLLKKFLLTLSGSPDS